MKKVILLLALIAGMVSLSAYSISGFTNLLDSPIEGAVVELHSQPGMSFYPDDMTTSDANGYYHFEISSPGMYFVSAIIQEPFYQYLFYDNVSIPVSATPIHLSNVNPDQDNINFNFQATFPGGNNLVTGSVTDVSSQPVENVWIDLHPVQYSSPWLTMFSTNTDANGNFSLENLPDGEYILSAMHPNYLPYFYNGTPAWPQAEIIVLENGTVEQIDIVLESNSLFIVSGTVIDSNSGNPIVGAKIQAFKQNSLNPNGSGMGCHGMHITMTDQNGIYHLTLPEDQYLIMAEDPQTKIVEFYENATTPLTALWLDVTQNLNAIDFELNDNIGGNYSVSGTLSVGGNNNPGVPMLAVAVSSDEEWEETVAAEATTGGYVIPDLPGGEYYVYAFSPISIPTFFEDAINYEDAVLVNVQNNVSGIDIDMLIAQETGYLNCSGFVLDDSGEPVINATVAFVDPFGNIQDFAFTDNFGAYNLPALNSLNYTAFATKVFYNSDQTQLPVNGNLTWDFILNDPNTATDEELPEMDCDVIIYPNPFNPTTTISFSAEELSENAKIEIFNLKGQKVKSFESVSCLDNGRYTVVWQGDDNSLKPVSTGVYLLKIKTSSVQKTAKLLLLK